MNEAGPMDADTPDRVRAIGFATALAPLRGSARFAVFGLAAIAIAGCAPRAPDTPVPNDIDDRVRKIAAGDSIDARFARVILADGRVTVREVKTWLAESEAEAGKK